MPGILNKCSKARNREILNSYINKCKVLCLEGIQEFEFLDLKNIQEFT